MAIGTVFELDDFSAWVDDASIQIKAVTGNPGDPVDLGTDQVCEIIVGLTALILEADGPDAVKKVIADLTQLVEKA